LLLFGLFVCSVSIDATEGPAGRNPDVAS
jgi:hypothetical protein